MNNQRPPDTDVETIVKRIVRRFVGPKLDREDIAQIARTAYLEAVIRYSGGDFYGYVSRCMIGAVRDALKAEHRQPKPGAAIDRATAPETDLIDASSLSETLSLFAGDERRLAERLALGDTEEEAAATLGVTRHHVRRLAESIKHRLSLVA